MQHYLHLLYNLSSDFRYTSQADYTLVVTVSNKISVATVSTTVIVQHTLASLTLDVIDRNPDFSGEVLFRVNTYQSCDSILFQWSFGDGSHSYNIEETFEDIFSLVHTYNVGTFEMMANVSNFVSFFTLSKSIISEESITGVEILVDKFVIKPGEYLDFNVFTRTGSNIILEMNYGNGDYDVISKNNSKRGNTDSFVQKVLNTPGEITVTIKLSNAISEWVDTIGPVYIQYPVTRIKVSLGLIIPSVPNQVSVEIAYELNDSPPTAVTCEVVVHDDWSALEYVPELSRHTSLLVHVLTGAGIYGWTEVKVNCSNKLSYKFIETGTYIQEAVADIAITADKSFTEIGGSVNFAFHIGRGSNVEYAYWFGLGQNYTGTLSSTLITNKVMEDSCNYGLPGEYQVTFMVWNGVSAVVVHETIWVLEEITVLSVTRFYEQSSVYNILNYGHGKEKNIFPVQRPVKFKVNVASGNSVSYGWNFGDGNETTVEQDMIDHSFKAEGVYTISVAAFNHMYSETVSVIIDLYEIVLPLKLTNSGPTKSYKNMEFTLSLTYSGTEACHSWDFGDGSPVVITGSEMCAIQNSPDSVSVMRERSSIVNYTHMYSEEGLYTVSVTTSNEVSTATISSYAIISGISCYYPVVSINGGRQTIEIPIKKLVSDWIILESIAVINCETTSGPVYKWNIQKVLEGDTYLNYILEPYDIDIASVDKLKVYFKPRTLEVGLYIVSLNVSMIDIPGLYTEEHTYLKVDASPLVAEVKEGSTRLIGFDKILVLDGLTGSYDPDSKMDSKSHLQFEWWCRRPDEDFAESLVDDIEIGLVDVLNVTGDKKGCFETGIGRLPFTSGLVEVSSMLLGLNTVNVFKLVVKDGSRQAVFEQEVHVVEGDPPQIYIQ